MMHSGALQISTPSEHEFRFTRAFDAPRALVYRCWTTPELLMRWLGPRSWPLVVCEIDLRVGGAYRYVSRGPDGSEMTIRGVYREVAPPERLVATEAFDGSPDEALATTLFAEEHGRTMLTCTVRYPTREARDAVLASRMEHGLSEGFSRLDALLAAALAGDFTAQR